MGFFKRAFGFVASPSHSRTMGLVIMLVLVSAISLTVISSQQQQTTKQRAAGNECALDYSSCDYEYGTCTRENCNALAAPAESPNRTDYQTDEDYGAAYDKYKTDYENYTANYSNCSETCRATHETCKQNAYNVYSECYNKSNSSTTPEIPTATPETLAPTAAPETSTFTPPTSVFAPTALPIIIPTAFPAANQTQTYPTQSPEDKCITLRNDFNNLVNQYSTGNIKILDLNNLVQEYSRQNCQSGN